MAIVLFAFWFIIGGAVGAAIGSSKGRAGQGFLLGLLLGFIGWLIVAFLEPTAEVRNRRQTEQLATMAAMGGVFSSSAVPATTSLTHAAQAPAPLALERVCPYCAETVKAAAILCRFCGRDLAPVAPAPLPPPPQTRPFVEMVITSERWLPDPGGGDRERLWNGTKWTEHVRRGERYSRDPFGRNARWPPPTEFREPV